MDALSVRPKIASLIVNMKLSERCNLNCSYCYYYADEYSEVYQRPSLLRTDVSEAAIKLLSDAAEDYDIHELNIAFHGGEPTLMNPRSFRALCERLVSELKGKVGALNLITQTNGVHISDAWLEVARDYDVHIGVSIDGPKDYNDRYRLDHKGNGSYDRIKKTIDRLKKYAHEGHIRPISIIAVINPEFDYDRVYDHFVSELGVGLLNFLLPDNSWDSADFDEATLQRFSDALICMFERWMMEGQDEVYVKQFSDILHRIAVHQRQKSVDMSAVNLVIHSDGELALNDSYMAAVSWFRSQQKFNVKSSSFRQWMSQPIMAEIEKAYRTLPDGCQSCRYRDICRGGELEHRFKSGSGFNNPSVYCSSLQQLFAFVGAALQEGGCTVSADIMEHAHA